MRGFSLLKKYNLNAVLLAVYVFLVVASAYYVDKIFKINLVTIAFDSILILIAILIISPWILKAFSNIQIPCVMVEKKSGKKYFFLLFAISLALFLICYIAYYPGGFSPDSISQYSQAVTGEYSDWHPVLHTLIFFTIPYKITANPASIVLFQIIYFSFALAYMGYVVLINSNAKFAMGALILILVNPATWNIAMYPWKDVGLAIVAIVLMSYAMQIYFSKGKWAEKLPNVFLVAVFLCLATIFRHNAILFTLPLLIALLLFITKKRRLQLIAFFIGLIVLVEGPLYSILNPEQPGSRALETLGLPLTIIGNVVINCPEELDDETKDFVYTIASQENWEKYYTCGNFNSLKWTDTTNTNIVDEVGALTVLKIMVKCIKISPTASLQAFIRLTGMVYSGYGEVNWSISPSVSSNTVGITYNGIQSLKKVFNKITALSQQSCFLNIIFWHIGFYMLIMLVCVLSKINFKDKKDWKKLMLCVPIFVHNFGTMLLLTGNDFRFFYLTIPITPCVVLILMHDQNTGIMTNDGGKSR